MLVLCTYVCVAENVELLVFFYFFLHLPLSHIHHKNFANGTAKGNWSAIVEDNYSRSNLLTTNNAADIISFYKEMLN